MAPPEAVTIDYLLDRYFRQVAQRKGKNTLVSMRSKIGRLLDFFGSIKWEDSTQTDVENYINHARGLTRWDRGEKQLSDGTTRKDLEIVRAALRHAHLHKIMPTETCIETCDLSSESRTDWLTKEQMKRFLDCCGDNREREHIYAFLLIAL